VPPCQQLRCETDQIHRWHCSNKPQALPTLLKACQGRTVQQWMHIPTHIGSQAVKAAYQPIGHVRITDFLALVMFLVPPTAQRWDNKDVVCNARPGDSHVEPAHLAMLPCVSSVSPSTAVVLALAPDEPSRIAPSKSEKKPDVTDDCDCTPSDVVFMSSLGARESGLESALPREALAELGVEGVASAAARSVCAMPIKFLSRSRSSMTNDSCRTVPGSQALCKGRACGRVEVDMHGCAGKCG
jgi:hypothetical protein